MNHAESQTGDHPRPADAPRVRWRPWPCESCRGSTTALDFLVGCVSASTEIPEIERNQQIDWLKKWEAGLLREWVGRCPHTTWSDLSLPWLAEGSEHIVLFDEAPGEVVKITRPGLYGDYYEIHDNRISQFDSTITEYLLRMRWWEELFSLAPEPIGVTDAGQIVSRQRFMRGDLPAQHEVDRFLADAGLVAVKQPCWLWKKGVAASPIEVWIGDARSDNFVSAAGVIIPIDIRVWVVPVLPEKDT
jgi:hypothetical protein